MEWEGIEKVDLKRRRPEELETFTPQSKVHVSEKTMEAKDATKMKQIYDKTINLLFKGAKMSTTIEKKLDKVSQLVRLSGNGEIFFSNFTDCVTDAALEQSISLCCNREVYIRDCCADCSMVLCEYCGYSCSKCDNFLCTSCVTLFGHGTADCPICDKCSTL